MDGYDNGFEDSEVIVPNRKRFVKKIWISFQDKIKACKNKSKIENESYELTKSEKSDFNKNSIELALELFGNELNNKQTAQTALSFYIQNLAIAQNEKPSSNFINELVDKGADINYLNEFNENLLFKAIETDNIDLVKILIEKNVNLKQNNKFGCNIFHIAAKITSVSIIRLLANKFNEEDLKIFLSAPTNLEKQTPLHYAAKEGSIEIAECLISEYNVYKEPKDYRNRTPLFIAAEFNRKSMVKLLMRLKCCVSFTDESKKETLNNIKGQTALYWIVTKMPDIAKDALDQLYEPNPYSRKDKHYLSPLEPKVIEKTKQDDFIEKSTLTAIVESENLDLIVHPTVLCLINIKWKAFGKLGAYIDLIITILNVAVWIAFGVWVPYNVRHKYQFDTNLDRLRLCLFLLGIVFTLYLMITEIIEAKNEYKFQKKANEERSIELNQYLEDMSKENEKTKFVREEKIMLKKNNMSKILGSYCTDIWNIFDWVSIILLLACIGTHVEDVRAHTEYKARVHIRIMSVTIAFISVRLLKSARILIPKFGTLVMILYYSLSDMVIWFILYLVIWMSFSCSLWMIYGATKFEKSSNEDGLCKDVHDIELNEAKNCTTISIYEFERFSSTAYYLYRVTFGYELDEGSMNLIDNKMTEPFIGTYIGLTSLVLVNIFIALLSATFTRVYEKAEAYIIFQRATEILNKEKSMSYSERKRRINDIRKIGKLYIDKKSNEILTTMVDRMTNLENEMKEQRKLISDMENSMEISNLSMKNQLEKTNESISKLHSEVKELKEALMSFMQNRS